MTKAAFSDCLTPPAEAKDQQKLVNLTRKQQVRMVSVPVCLRGKFFLRLLNDERQISNDGQKRTVLHESIFLLSLVFFALRSLPHKHYQMVLSKPKTQ